MEKKNIAVLAYFEKNLGDDLFIKMLLERYPNVNWYLIGAHESYKGMFPNMNIQTISKRYFLLNFYKFDALINIGGSIFIQTPRWYGYFIKRLALTLPLKVLKRKVFVLGANFGPYNSNLFEKSYNYYFKILDDVCFRDSKSYNLYRNINRVRVAPDIIYGLNTDKYNVPTEPNSMGVSVMSLINRQNLRKYNKDYLNNLSESISDLIKRGFNIKLFSFCKEEGDERAIKDILTLISPSEREYIEVINYNGNIDEFLYQYSKVESFITLRFHSLILSQLFNQNIYPITYSDKTINVLEDCSIQDYLHIKNITKINSERILNYSNKHNLNIKYKSKSSNQHFSLVDNFLPR
ncbi:polysaccharide pyruvyl transferase family protein [Pontibacillus salicampi]|uniref:Polysaccharide pyruvyl transferase family protein n=1 Tax=Pontibacillus salicampi TaxID=1449801 RepID=A0ABV6LSC9_9BACI